MIMAENLNNVADDEGAKQVVKEAKSRRSSSKQAKKKKTEAVKAQEDLFKNADEDILSLAPKEVRDMHEQERLNEARESEDHVVDGPGEPADEEVLHLYTGSPAPAGTAPPGGQPYA